MKDFLNLQGEQYDLIRNHIDSMGTIHIKEDIKKPIHHLITHYQCCYLIWVGNH